MNLPQGIESISVETVDHNDQRYDTVGDYRFLGTALDLTVSDMGDWRMGIACAVHEIIEASLLVTNKIPEYEVTAFDKEYEDARQAVLSMDRETRIEREVAIQKYRARWRCDCDITDDSEPGEDVHAPYHREHMFADGIERLVARELGVRWPDYQEAVLSLEYRPTSEVANGEEVP